MGLELYNEKGSDLIPMCELKGGQIAVVEDDRNPEYKNSIVTRSGSVDDWKAYFIILGLKSAINEYASKTFLPDCPLLVRVLPPGTLLKIT